MTSPKLKRWALFRLAPEGLDLLPRLAVALRRDIYGNRCLIIRFGWLHWHQELHLYTKERKYQP